MPSWNEKAHVVPTINVNLTPCNKDIRPGETPEQHEARCPAKPVLIPCPIPRSVTIEVRLGDCNAGCATLSPKDGPVLHYKHCAARTTRVSCSIAGTDWGRTRIEDAETLPEHETAIPRVWDACRDRWALVANLLTGHLTESGPEAALVKQRNTVFAALSAQSRLEAEMLAAQQATVAAIASPRLTASETNPEDRPSAQALAVYVERLIEQVGILGMES